MGITPTKQQEKIIDRDGIFVVRACPGSGKTFTVAARMARLLKTWDKPNQGIAAISFTNVAWQEIEKYLIEEFRIPRPRKYPHFIGTIDSFVNNYLFLPFGHLVMGCEGRPQFCGNPHNNIEPIGNWMYWGTGNSECFGCGGLNDFAYNVKGDDVINQANDYKKRAHYKKCDKSPKVCFQRKIKLNETGWASQSDANYFALKIIKNYPKIAKAIVNRFPSIIVDEAQDTSIIQMVLLDTLKENGLRGLMLVGDPDQSIFEWRTADPEVFLEKCRDNELLTEYLSENLRSTKNICNFANYLTENKMTAANPELKSIRVDSSKMIWGYQSDDELPEVIERFIDICQGMGIETSQVNVLVRGRNTIKKIIPGAVQETKLKPWKEGYQYTQDICRSKYLFEKGDFKTAFRTLERTVCRGLNNNRFCHPDVLKEMVNILGFEEWRGLLYGLLNSLPSTDISLGEWIRKANIVLQSTDITSELKLIITRDSKRQGKTFDYSKIKFDELFSNPETLNLETEYEVGTVHSAKGKTLEAVLFILRKGPAPGSNHYPRLLKEEKLSENEELRIVYVAITRARKILVLAVPEEHRVAWKKKFLKI